MQNSDFDAEGDDEYGLGSQLSLLIKLTVESGYDCSAIEPPETHTATQYLEGARSWNREHRNVEVRDGIGTGYDTGSC